MSDTSSQVPETKQENQPEKVSIPLELIPQIIILASIANQTVGTQRLNGNGPRIAAIVANVIDICEPMIPRQLPTTEPKGN